MRYYTLKICGYTKKLPIVKIGPKFSVASFSLLGDVDFVEALAQELVERIKYLDFQFLIGPEIKILPLIFAMSNILGQKNYLVARKRIMSYMSNPVKSDGKKPLVLNGPDAKMLEGKKAIMVNDVVGTGKTIREIKNLLENAGAELAGVASVLKQGDKKIEIERPFFYLQKIPLFNI